MKYQCVYSTHRPKCVRHTDRGQQYLESDADDQLYGTSDPPARLLLMIDEGFCESPSRGLSNFARFCSNPVPVTKRLKRSHWCMVLLVM